MKALFSATLPLILIAAPGFATVVVSSPTNGETVSTTATYVATSTATTCCKGVASMGVYVDNDLVNASIPLTAGNHHTVVQEWDYCGGSTYTPIAVTVVTQSGVHVTSPVPNST